MSERTEDPATVARGVEAGEPRAIARSLSWIENRADEGQRVLELVAARARPAFRVGVTGAPGVGKSSFIARIVPLLRRTGERIAIMAIDPTSPVTGGALLGDRLRMRGLDADPGVYIRSLATRSGRGGLAATTAEALDLLDSAGFGLVVVETIGVGQLEIAVADETDITFLLLSPEAGDAIQLLKGGMVEVADGIVIHKADRPGAEELLRAAEEVARDQGQLPPIPVSSTTGAGVEAAAARIEESWRVRAEVSPAAVARRCRRIEQRLARRAEERWLKRAWTAVGGASAAASLARDVTAGSRSFGDALVELVKRGDAGAPKGSKS